MLCPYFCLLTFTCFYFQIVLFSSDNTRFWHTKSYHAMPLKHFYVWFILNGGVFVLILPEAMLFLFDIVRGVVSPLLWACRRLCLFVYWYELNDIIRGVVSPLLGACRRLCLFLFDADWMILFEEWFLRCFESAGGSTFSHLLLWIEWYYSRSSVAVALNPLEAMPFHLLPWMERYCSKSGGVFALNPPEAMPFSFLMWIDWGAKM